MGKHTAKWSIHINWPMFRLSPVKSADLRGFPWRRRWFHWAYWRTKCSIQEFGGSRVNTRYDVFLFRYLVAEIRRNEYEDRSDKERADHYLSEWSKCEKELRNYKLMALGEGMDSEVKKVIKDSMGVDLDEGTIL